MKSIKRVFVNTLLILVLVFILIAPPAFSAVVMRTPVEKENLELPSFVLFQNDKELNPHIQVSKAQEGLIWQVPISYTLQPRITNKQEKVLSVVNTSDKVTVFKIMPSSSSIYAVFHREGSSGDTTMVLSPKGLADIDLVFENSGRGVGQTADFILNLSGTVVSTY